MATVNGTSGDDTLYGTAGSDTINGLGGNDSLKGFGGADRLDGGTGIDTVFYDDSSSAVAVNLATGRGFGGSAEGDTLVSIERVFASAHNDTLTGNDETNDLYGLGGSDVLKGGGGADRLDGGSGDDILKGGGGADVLIGGDGNDTADYSQSPPSAGEGGVFVSLNSGNTANGDAAGDTLIGIENLIGSAFVDQLIGNDGANSLRGMAGRDSLSGLGGDDRLEGGAGDDQLDGGLGIDVLIGDVGNDRYYVDHAGDVVIELAGEGFDTVFARTSYALAAGAVVEELATWDQNGSPNTDAINLTGNAFVQTLTGNAGDNRLDGRGGADTMVGKSGNDSYLVRDAGDKIVEFADEGNDIVFAAVSYVLTAAARVESLSTTSLVGTDAISLTGNAFAQTVTGNDGANTLDGGSGAADTLSGRGGDDRYLVRDAGDVIIELDGQGTDTVLATVSYVLTAAARVENLSTTSLVGTAAINLTGNSFAQTVTGNDGANVLNGGAGNDTLNGRGGADTFVFDTALNAATNVDTIVGYNVADDVIHLENAIFLGLPAGVLAASAFFAGAGATAAADAADRIIYNTTTGALFFDADGVGGAAAVQFAVLSGAPAITNAEFVVI